MCLRYFTMCLKPSLRYVRLPDTFETLLLIFENFSDLCGTLHDMFEIPDMFETFHGVFEILPLFQFLLGLFETLTDLFQKLLEFKTLCCCLKSILVTWRCFLPLGEPSCCILNNLLAWHSLTGLKLTCLTWWPVWATFSLIWDHAWLRLPNDVKSPSAMCTIISDLFATPHDFFETLYDILKTVSVSVRSFQRSLKHFLMSLWPFLMYLYLLLTA